MVDATVGEFSPVLESFAHTVQPLSALVFIVAVRGVPKVVTAEDESVPSGSVLPLSANEKTDGTVAVTTTWSSVMLAVA